MRARSQIRARIFVHLLQMKRSLITNHRQLTTSFVFPQKFVL